MILVEDGILNVPPSDKTDMTILGYKTTLFITPGRFFYMTSNWVTPSLLGIHISADLFLESRDLVLS